MTRDRAGIYNHTSEKEAGSPLEQSKLKQYIYIVQASLEPSRCKIGKTNDLERRLKEYNNITGKSKKDVLRNAQKVKNDKFYTRYEDIETELSMYPKKIWKNKTVFCNGDDAVDNNGKNTSAFALYFLRNFQVLGLKKLICTHYGGPVDLFNQGPKGYVFTKDGFSEIKTSPPNYTGSFDDPLSLKILNEEADIVCTNPPFSRAIEYWKTVIESRKKFIIISNIANPITKAFIPYFRDHKVWAGYNRIDYFL
ncbi:MAG: GIY-YIG nuclease family protein, partial [Planctomycetaceae bacterium]|nr:GIY-YIG nuclease family protein [Planctomycetaceae bacterium]